MPQPQKKIKRIAVVIPRYGLVGGGELYALELTERLARNSAYEIHVFANKWRQRSTAITFHKVPVISFPKFLTSISFAYFANRLIAKMNFDLIHTHDRIFAADIYTMHGIPHRVWVEKVRKKRMSLFDLATSWVEKKLVAGGRCKKFLSVSSLAQEKFLQRYDVNPLLLDIVCPGVDVERFKMAREGRSRAEVRQKFNFQPTDKVVLFVSMNFELKGLDILISALSQIKSSGDARDFKLLVVGKGNQGKFEKMAGRLGVEQHIVFTGTWHENIESLYGAADIFVMLSKFDTFGIVVLEAMAASLPVLISDQVGAKDTVTQGVNGFVVKRDDTGNIIKKLLVLFDDQTRKKMAKNTAVTALNCTWDHTAQNISSLYDQLLSMKVR